MASIPMGKTRTLGQLKRCELARQASLARGRRTDDQVAELLSDDENNYSLKDISRILGVSYEGVKLSYKRIKYVLNSARAQLGEFAK